MVEAALQLLPDAIARGDFVYRSPSPPVFIRGDGVFLTDDRGCRFLDAEAANGAAVLGYDSTILQEAMDRLAGLSALPSFCESRIRLELARKIVDLFETTTGDRGRVAFETGGAQGIELALKIARANTRADRVVVFEGGYHGRSFLTSALSASQRYRDVAGSTDANVTRLPLPDCRRCRFSREPGSCAAECAQFAEFTLSNDAAGVLAPQGGGIAALIFEPVLNVAGMTFPDSRYIQAAVAAVRRQGGIIIADEVFTGLYRSGKPFGFMHHGVVPDIVVISKGLSNGIVPISCVWARADVLSPDRFPPGSHSTTYINAPVGCAVASVVLDRLARLPVARAVERVARGLRRSLHRATARHPIVARLDVYGASARVILTQPVAAQVRQAALVCEADHPAQGLILASTGMRNDVINVHPSFTILDEELDLLERLLDLALDRVEQAITRGA